MIKKKSIKIINRMEGERQNLTKNILLIKITSHYFTSYPLMGNDIIEEVNRSSTPIS